MDERGRDVAGPKQWGSLGRRGAGRLGESRIDSRNAAGATARDDRPDPGNRPVRWERVDTEEVREEASGAVGRGRKPSPRAGAGGRSRRPAGDSLEKAIEPKERRGRAARPASKGSGGADARDALVSALGAARGSKANERLRDAAHAFERERYEEARKLLRPLAEVAPQVAAVRELLGLTYYRLGKWSDALRELGSFREMTRSTEQHPVLADCNRALKRHSEVEALWDELRDVSPSPDLVAEGRIVMAGSLADRNRMREAISLLEKSQRSVKRPQVHHLRQAYVLADLYERGGDVTRARELFRWIVVHEAGFADAAERAGALT